MLNTFLRLNTMITLMWITVTLLGKIDSVQINHINQPNPMIIADVGDSVTLNCYRLQAKTSGAIVWYKQKIGHEPRVIVTVQSEPSYEDEFKSPRFSIENKGTSCHLKIAHLEASDEAMYYCGLLQFFTTFGNGTFLSVKVDEDVNVSVNQRSVSDSVPAGASVTLQCSVLSESRAAELQVLWFRAAPSQSHPQIIYTHHNSSLQCESESSTHTCVYNLSKNIFSLDDTGTYYCAVVVSGKIIFGNGTRVQLERSVDPVVICLAGALGLCVLLIFTLFIIKRESGNHKQHRVTLKHDFMADATLDQDSDSVEVKYAALNFNERTVKRGRVTKQQPKDIIYSHVRHPSVT